MAYIGMCAECSKEIQHDDGYFILHHSEEDWEVYYCGWKCMAEDAGREGQEEATP